jgi:hypothetical protein
VSEGGEADAFITLTTNTMWPEIQERLLPGQSAYSAPVIVAEVFNARLAAFLHNLRYDFEYLFFCSPHLLTSLFYYCNPRNGKYFQKADGTHARVKYILRVIEWQHR